MSKRAILYVRVSTPRQAEFYSLAYQLERERQYAEEVGLSIVAEFADDMSGRKLERDGLTEARHMLARGDADVLVVWKLDRLHRNYINTVLLREEIQRLGKELHYAQMRMKSGATAKQRLPEDIMALMAEIEADEIAERTAMGKREKAEKGGKWIGLNRPPYGYKAIGKGQDVRLEIDEETAPVVRNIFEWYALGDETGQALSAGKIAEKLTVLGVPTSLDTIPERTHQKVRGYAQWSRSSVGKILRQPAYSGTYIQFRYKSHEGKARVNRGNDQVRVTVPRIVPLDIYEAAMAKLEKGREISSRGAKYNYLVGRRIWCECGYKMRSNSTYREHTRPNGEQVVYHYKAYRCPARRSKNDKHVHHLHSCDLPALDAEIVDAVVWRWVKGEIGNPQILASKLHEIQQEQKKGSRAKEDALRTLYSHRQTIEREMKRLATLYAREEMPARIIDELMAEQGAKLKRFEAEMGRLAREMGTPLSDEVIEGLLAFSKRFQSRLGALEESFEGKRAVIDGLDVQVTMVRRDDEVVLRVTSMLQPEGDFLAVGPSSSSWVRRRSSCRTPT